MDSASTDSLTRWLLRHSASGPSTIIAGRDAARFFGPGFDLLLAKGVLTEFAPASSWPPCRDCTCGPQERLIVRIDGALVAECPDDAAASVVLTPADLRAFAIDVDAVVVALAAGTGWPEPPEQLGASVWRLGNLDDGRAVVAILDPQVFRTAPLLPVLRAVPSPPSSTTLLVPPGVDANAQRPFRDMRYHLVGLLDAVHPTMFALARERLVPPAGGAAQLAAGDILLVINPMGFTASFAGVPFALRPRDFEVLVVLAREAADGRAMARRDDLMRALAEKADSAEPIAEEQLEKSISRIREALCIAVGLPRDQGRRLIVNVPRRGYRLATPPVRTVLA